jgi:hypothetical protein
MLAKTSFYTRRVTQQKFYHSSNDYITIQSTLVYIIKSDTYSSYEEKEIEEKREKNEKKSNHNKKYFVGL